MVATRDWQVNFQYQLNLGKQMKINQKWVSWSALGSVVFLMAACGGDSGSSKAQTDSNVENAVNPAQSAPVQTADSSKTSGEAASTKTKTAGDIAAGTKRAGDVAADTNPPQDTAENSQSQEETVSRNMAGFSNLGHTGYANSALKFMIHTVGEKRLLAHLEDFKDKPENIAERQAAEHFIQLITKAYSTPGPIKKELEDLFHSLEALKHPSLASMGRIVDNVHNLHTFPDALMEVFKFNEIAGASTYIKQVKTERDPSRYTDLSSEETVYPKSHIQTARSPVNGATLQQYIGWINNNIDKLGNGRILIRDGLVNVADAEKFDTFIVKLDLNGHERQYINFTSDVKMVIHDEKTQKKFLATLTPKAFYVQKHIHCIADLRDDSGIWFKHDDENISRRDSINYHPMESALRVSFSVKSISPIS